MSDFRQSVHSIPFLCLELDFLQFIQSTIHSNSLPISVCVLIVMFIQEGFILYSRVNLSIIFNSEDPD